MADKDIKLFEVSGRDWLSGLSTHPYIPVGGIFQQASNFDPFQKVGIYMPTPTPVRFSSIDPAEDIFAMVIHTSSGVGGVNFIDALAAGNVVYRIKTSDGTITAQGGITNSGSRGATIFKNKTIYSSGSAVYANNYPLSSVNSETALFSVSGVGPQKMHIGPDRNLYITNDNKIGRITSVTGTTGNSNYITFEDDVICRGLDDDGQHLIIGGDTNLNNLTTGGRHRCFVAFWNMKSQDLTRIWEFTDDTVLGVASVSDEVLVICSDAVYTCSVGSRPVPLITFKGNSSFDSIFGEYSPSRTLPIVKKDNGTVLWAFGKQIMGYGTLHPSLPKTLFTGYTIPDHPSFTTIQSMIYNDLNDDYPLWVSTDSNRVYAFPTTTSETSTTKMAGIDFKQPYEFSFAKVILNKKLESGQSVDVEIKTDEGNNTVLRDSKGTTNSFSFTNFGAKKSHIFYHYPGAQSASTIAVFEDLSDIQIRNIGAEIRRFEIWGKPLRGDQDIYK